MLNNEYEVQRNEFIALTLYGSFFDELRTVFPSAILEMELNSKLEIQFILKVPSDKLFGEYNVGLSVKDCELLYKSGYDKALEAQIAAKLVVSVTGNNLIAQAA